MKQLELLHRINELFANFVTQVKGLNSLNLYDINIISEAILIPLFKEIFQLPNLKNVNDDKKNYPSIDLADDSKKVAFQVTATKTSKKVNDTLQLFFKHGLDSRYDKLYCYILTEKQDSYTINSTELDESDLDFKPDRDILDYTDLLKRIQNFEIDKIDKIEKILEEQFAVTEKLKSTRQDITIDDSSPWKAKLINNETLCSNLLEITFPDKLYIATLGFDRKEVLKASRCEGGSYLKNTATMRQVAREALHQKGYRFANDWTCHEKNLITFHGLNDDFNPLLNIVDEGTIEQFDTDGFFRIDSDHENVFRGLLHLCLIRFLYQKNVGWKHEERVFIFLPETTELKRREINWHGKVNAKRTVFEAYKKKKSEGISYCKHLAFRTFYRRYEERWFIEIIPTWYISYDGYNKSRFGHEKIKFFKRLERNQSVYNHLKFITYFLKEKEHQMQIGETKPEPRGFLEFHELVKFTGHPNIDDNLWNKNEDKEKQKRLSDPQQPLFSDF